MSNNESSLDPQFENVSNPYQHTAQFAAAQGSQQSQHAGQQGQQLGQMVGQQSSGAGGQFTQNQWQQGGQQAGGMNEQGSFSTDTLVVAEEKKRRMVPLSGAIALALVASIGAGTATGVYSYNQNNSASTSQVLEQLRTPVANTSTNPDSDVSAVAAAVLPSVVSIQVLTRTSVSEGSGSIISSDGYVMTNNHVVSDAAQGASNIVVTLNDGTEMQADFVAGDANTDVAVIKIRDAEGLPVMSFGDSSSLTVGQEVVAIGSPLGLSATVTSGIVSALNRPVRAGGSTTGESSLIDGIQTDAAINPGNSGGPLVDMNGNLIGMNSVIASLSSGTDSSGSIGLGFAIPANFARRVADQLISTGEVTHPMLSVQLNGNANVRGALITEVMSGGPAEAAGLQAGDVVTKINDRNIDSADALIAAVRSSDFGETVTLTVTDQNGSNEHEVQVTLTDS